VPVSNYCSLPEQCDTWFKAYHKAVEMCGGRTNTRRVISRKETEYLDQLVRGAYARRDLEPGYKIHKNSFEKDFYLAIPLRKGQLSCREIMNGETLRQAIKADEALTIDHIDGPYATNPALKNLIKNRGL
jgi:N-acetylneuraminate synthase